MVAPVGFLNSRTRPIQARGIMGGGSNALTNPATNGRYKSYNFRNLMPNNSTDIVLTDINSQISQAEAAGHLFSVILNPNSADPSSGINGLPLWLRNAGAVAWPGYNANHDTYLYQFVSWDPIFLAALRYLIAGLGAAFDGRIASIIMGGFGATAEWGVTTPSPDGLSDAAANAAWIGSSKTLLQAYGTAFRKTVFMGALSEGGALESDSLQTVVDFGLALYGPHFGFTNWGCNARTADSLPSPIYLPDKIIYDHRDTNPTEFQMAGNSDGTSGGDLKGTLRQSMDAALAYGVDSIQVFGTDTAKGDPSDPTYDPAFAADFAAVAASFGPPPLYG